VPKSESPHPDVDTFLLIEVQYDRESPIYQWWLAGPPPHGTHPDPAGAWQALLDAGEPFRGYDDSTQDYHGPERAVIRGFWRGTWIEYGFGRYEGAAAYEWDRLRPFLEPDSLRHE
jgi:hypothetical protein